MRNNIKAYKGFDKDLKCRGFQFKKGETFKHKGDVTLCNGGFHSCEYPLDVFNYYSPSNSRFFRVEASGKIDHHASDSKIASARIYVDCELNINDLTKAAIKWIIRRLNKDKPAASNTGNKSAASNTGNKSAASNTGDYSAASNTGNKSAASNTGYQSAASNTGDYSAASNTGNCSAASNTGDQSAASNTGNCSAASNTGKNAIAVASGVESKAKASKGSAIVLCSYDDNGNLIHIKSAITGKKYSWGVVKPDVWYTLTSEGRFKVVDDE